MCNVRGGREAERGGEWYGARVEHRSQARRRTEVAASSSPFDQSVTTAGDRFVGSRLLQEQLEVSPGNQMSREAVQHVTTAGGRAGAGAEEI